MTTTTAKGIIVRILTLIHRLCIWMKFVASFPQAFAHAHDHAHKYIACVPVSVMCITANQLLGGYKVVVIVTSNSLFVRLSCGWHTQYEVVKNCIFFITSSTFPKFGFKIEACTDQTENLADWKPELLSNIFCVRLRWKIGMAYRIMYTKMLNNTPQKEE